MMLISDDNEMMMYFVTISVSSHLKIIFFKFNLQLYYNITFLSSLSDKSTKYVGFQFAEWCFDYGRHGCRTPDHPYSLFEGK